MKVLFLIAIDLIVIAYATVFLAISDAGWLAIPIIIGSLFTGVIGILTLFMNAKLNKNTKDTETIKTTVSEVATKVDEVGKNVDGKISLLLEEKDKVLEASKLSEHAAGKELGRIEATEFAEKTADKVIERANIIVEKVGEKVTPIVEKVANEVVDKIGEKVNDLIKKDEKKE